MPTSTDVTKLNINELTEAQYDAAVLGGDIGANDLSFLTDVNIETQVSTMPTASADELGKVYQFIGTTDANYTHGYFYECVSDGGNPATYSWSNIQVQASSGGLPSQTGNAGKFLITDGTNASWGTDIQSEENIVYDLTNSSSYRLKIKTYSDQAAVYFYQGTTPKTGITFNPTYISIGGCFNVEANALYPIGFTDTLGKSSDKWETAYIKKLNNGNNITVPTVAGSMSVQVSSMPTADSTLEGQIYQYTGATDSTYTNGRFYKCVSDGQPTPTYSWEEVSMGGGGSSYTAGTGIDITSGVISVTAPTLTNVATAGSGGLTIAGTPLTRGGVNIGYESEIASDSLGRSVIIGNYAKAGDFTSGGLTSGGNVAIGHLAKASGYLSVAIGHGQTTHASYAIQIGASNATNSDANTFKVANQNGNFEMMSADGTIPTDRYTTTPSADGTYVPTLTISSGVATRTWAAPSGGSPTTTTVTLAVNDWSNNSQTVNVSGVTASNLVQVAPAPSSNSDYVSGGVLCTAQGSGTLTFTCTTTPTNAITVNVVIFG